MNPFEFLEKLDWSCVLHGEFVILACPSFWTELQCDGQTDSQWRRHTSTLSGKYITFLVKMHTLCSIDSQEN